MVRGRLPRELRGATWALQKMQVSTKSHDIHAIPITVTLVIVIWLQWQGIIRIIKASVLDRETVLFKSTYKAVQAKSQTAL